MVTMHFNCEPCEWVVHTHARARLAGWDLTRSRVFSQVSGLFRLSSYSGHSGIFRKEGSDKALVISLASSMEPQSVVKFTNLTMYPKMNPHPECLKWVKITQIRTNLDHFRAFYIIFHHFWVVLQYFLVFYIFFTSFGGTKLWGTWG